MKPERFAFALDSLEPGDWARFERFASDFLVFDYSQIRTVAAAGGDLGRDSEIFSPDGDATTLLQYSVTKGWSTKIRDTAKRIRTNFPDASILVYVTNQPIGAAADELKKELRKQHKLILDIHDRNWFLERLGNPPERQAIAERLAVDVADPILGSKGVIESKAPALTGFESKVAVLHLQLQWEDDSRDKGLTKLSFEALVKSVLRGTTAETRLTRSKIHEAIHNLLPNHPVEVVTAYADSALARLEKKAVRHWKQLDEFCLTHEESLRVRDGMTRKEIKCRELDDAITLTLNEYFDAPLIPEAASALCARTRRVLDDFLLKKGEEFASAVARGESFGVRDDTLDPLVSNDFSSIPDTTNLGADAISAVRSTLREILQRSNPTVRHYLREVADGYTLFGFLRAVPDVQKIVQKVFRDGEIWLDTSVLLPVLAESLLSDDEAIMSPLLRAACDAGIKLRVTTGVIEELERHINRCITYYRMPPGQWTGSVPFLFAMYSLCGRPTSDFLNWIQEFCGKERPMDDIAEYLSSEWGVEVEDLHEYVDSTEEKLRWEVEQIWREAHEARRNSGLVEHEDHIIERLVSHDVECFLGVVGKRKQVVVSELGYSHWFMTFDRTVRDFETKLTASLGRAAPKAPVMSPDFLANYLAVGPVRAQVSKVSEASLPVALFDILSDHVPVELLEVAEVVRKECGAVNERLIRRRLRDTLDSFKKHRGAIAKGGFTALRERLEMAFKTSKQ